VKASPHPSRLRSLLLVAVLGACLIIAVLLARGPLRSTLGLSTYDSGCTPGAGHTRLPGDAVSRAGRWRPAPSYPIPRDEVRAAALAGRIYVGSGLRFRGGEVETLDEFFRFDLAREEYRSLPDLPEKVNHAAFVGDRGALYVIGGYKDDQPTASTWRFAPETGRWTALKPMHVPRGSPAAAVIADRIYVVGGAEVDRRGPRPSSALEIYDLDTGEWTRGPDMPTARHHHGAAAVGGVLFVVGGRAAGDLSVDAVERFDPASDQWERLAPLPLGAGGLAVVSVAGMVVAIGGGDDEESWVTPATWGFNPDEGRWRRLADLNVARHGHGAASVGSNVYVFGGAPCPGYGFTDVAESLTVERR
jgi:N-acetylneuraminic acid mutarotase